MYMVTPCFYCDKEALYGGSVEKTDDHYEVVEVCEEHFVFPSAS
jgi:hypothetical protein